VNQSHCEFSSLFVLVAIQKSILNGFIQLFGEDNKVAELIRLVKSTLNGMNLIASDGMFEIRLISILSSKETG
jgi:hypothetical protein